MRTFLLCEIRLHRVLDASGNSRRKAVGSPQRGTNKEVSLDADRGDHAHRKYTRGRGDVARGGGRSGERRTGGRPEAATGGLSGPGSRGHGYPGRPGTKGEDAAPGYAYPLRLGASWAPAGGRAEAGTLHLSPGQGAEAGATPERQPVGVAQAVALATRI